MNPYCFCLFALNLSVALICGDGKHYSKGGKGIDVKAPFIIPVNSESRISYGIVVNPNCALIFCVFNNKYLRGKNAKRVDLQKL
jgi:hypothetical protein